MANDFGFYFADDPEVTITAIKSEQSTAIEAAKKLYERINSLLTKLESNPDKPTINWPDRTAHVAKFRKELQAILTNAGITL